MASFVTGAVLVIDGGYSITQVFRPGLCWSILIE
jgi:hypothetical protein